MQNLVIFFLGETKIAGEQALASLEICNTLTNVRVEERRFPLTVSHVSASLLFIKISCLFES